MNDWAAPPSADRVPTLTEVVDLGGAPEPEAGQQLGSEATAEQVFVEAQDQREFVPPELIEGTPSVDWNGIDAPSTEAPPAPLPEAGPPVHSADAAPAAAPAVDPAALVALALAELQPRLDMLLESRLREALAPALARAAEGLIRDARGELGTALNELLQDAVRRALQRQAAHAPSPDGVPPHRP